MKLRNKKTGEIFEDVKFIDTTLSKITIQYLDNGVLREFSVENLSDVEEIKDYEEPKDYYIINLWGEVSVEGGKYQRPGLSELGLTFETKEEAEKAVEKLKAWKRLKDKGFEFCCDINYKNLCGNGFDIPLNAIMPAESFTDVEVNKDLYLLFGGEE